MPIHTVTQVGGTNLQCTTIIVALVSGIVVTVAMTHFALAALNYEHTYPEVLFVWWQERVFNETMRNTFQAFNNSLYDTCVKLTEGLIGQPYSPSVTTGAWYYSWPHWHPSPTVSKRRRKKYKERKRETNLEKREISYIGGYNSSVPLATHLLSSTPNTTLNESQDTKVNTEESETKPLVKRRAQQTPPAGGAPPPGGAPPAGGAPPPGGAPPAGGAPPPGSASPLGDAPPTGGAPPLGDAPPTGSASPLGDAPPTGGAPGEDAGQEAVTENTEYLDVTQTPLESCVSQAHHSVAGLNVVMNVARLVAMGSLEEKVSAIALILQVAGFILCVMTLITVCMMIIGAATLVLFLILPWIALWSGFLLFICFYIFIEGFFFVETPHKYTFFILLLFTVIFLVWLVLGLLMIYFVWCFVVLLTSPEGYIRKQNSIAQLLVTSRSMRNA